MIHPNNAPAGNATSEKVAHFMYSSAFSGFPILKCGIRGPARAKNPNIKPPKYKTPNLHIASRFVAIG